LYSKISLVLAIGNVLQFFFIGRQAESRCSAPDWEIYHNLGVCHTYLKEWDQAADLLRYILIYHNLGVCHTYLREWDQAADLLRYQQKILSY
jgi:thymidylate synthase